MSKNDGNKRAVNFTKSEENMLILLVKKYASIIENKKTDSCMNQKKNATWSQIAVEFNSAGGNTYRSLQILKNKYLNLKKKSLKKFSDEKKQVYITGGGTPEVYPDNEIDNSIKEIIGSRMTGLKSQFDSDSPTEIEYEISHVQEEIKVIGGDHTYFTDEMDVSEHPEPVEVIPKLNDRDHIVGSTSMKDLNIEKIDWSINSVDNIRTPVSTKLQVTNPKDVRKRDNTLRTKLSHWAKSKQDFVTLQQQCQSDESKQKLQHNEENHQEELKQKREIHEQRLLMMREEHAINISILKLQKEKLLREMTD